jgi:hypothetical protein
MGCTQSRISKIETGKDDELRLGELNQYLSALGYELIVTVARRDRAKTRKTKASGTSGR